MTTNRPDGADMETTAMSETTTTPRLVGRPWRLAVVLLLALVSAALWTRHFEAASALASFTFLGAAVAAGVTRRPDRAQVFVWLGGAVLAATAVRTHAPWVGVGFAVVTFLTVAWIHARRRP